MVPTQTEKDIFDVIGNICRTPKQKIINLLYPSSLEILGNLIILSTFLYPVYHSFALRKYPNKFLK